MNERDKELADKVRFVSTATPPTQDEILQHFADLIRADERERIKVANAPEIDRLNTHIKNLEDAVKNEREACAKVLESISNAPDMQSYAAVIRARGNT